MNRLTALVLIATGASACQPAATPPAEEMVPSTAITASIQGPYEAVKGYLAGAADQVSEDLYSFQPTPEVRTMGQLFAHIADANYMFCGAASGEAGPAESVEQTMTAKADLQAALAASFEFCDRAFAAVDDVTGAEAVNLEMMGMTSTKLGTLSLAYAHAFEHYGNIVTYMRMNSMVPPSSQPAPNM